MKIIEIKSLKNGAHRNQTINIPYVPNGWAVVPEDIETPNFPFGEIEVAEINGVMTVTKWTAAEIPETPEEETPITEAEQLRADIDYIAAMTGVDL